MKIIQATNIRVKEVSELFDMYRQYYGKNSDKKIAEKFISERLQNNESIIFVAIDEKNKTAGFVQVYFSFSSISAASALVLNDLFVKEEYRGLGVGKNLISSVIEYAKSIDTSCISLATKFDNYNAQSLYKKFGFVKDEVFYHYELALYR